MMFEILTSDISASTATLLFCIAFISGIGITTIGPGGIFLTVALYALTTLSAGVIAGTVQIAFIFTGLIGTLAYVNSGEISSDSSTQIVFLCGGSVGGALLGSWVNRLVSREFFGILLGCLAGVVGVTILYRQARSLDPIVEVNSATLAGKCAFMLLGIVLGSFSGLLGVGGPVIAVPALIMIGVPMLQAVAAAQVQSVFIAFFSATGYFLQGRIALSLAVLIAIPLAGGVILGWKIAHRVDPDRLKSSLGWILLLIAPYLAK